MKADMVFDGGGVKIPALLGGAFSLEQHGFEFSHVAGTSAGSIVAAGLAAGYDASEMKKLTDTISFKDFLDGKTWEPAKTLNLYRNLGWYKGEVFEEFMMDMLLSKGVYRFKDLLADRAKDRDDPRYRWKLKCIAADLTKGRMLTLPQDAHLYGEDPDDMSIAKAVRMSMSIPMFFEPVRFGDSLIVDGGLLSNFPIWCWDSVGTPEWPTFGLLLQSEDENRPRVIDGLISYMFGLFKTMIDAHDRKFIRAEDFENRTIAINTGSVSATDFDIGQDVKEKLYHSGRVKANEFLGTWDWKRYQLWAKKIRGLRRG